MNLLPSRYRFTTLLVLCVALGLIVVLVEARWLLASSAIPVKPSAPAPADVKLLPSFALPPIEPTFQEMVARPLFIHTRRPAPPAAATTPKLQPGRFQLLGTSVSKELGDTAFLKEVATNKTHVVRRGDSISGTTLDVVLADRVTLKVGEESEEVVIRAQASSKSPQAFTPGPPPLAPPPGSALSQPPGAALPVPGQQPGGPPRPTPGQGPGPLPTAQPAPGAAAATAAPAAPPTPEEIMARRRAARAQQTQ